MGGAFSRRRWIRSSAFFASFADSGLSADRRPAPLVPRGLPPDSIQMDAAIIRTPSAALPASHLCRDVRRRHAALRERRLPMAVRSPIWLAIVSDVGSAPRLVRTLGE